MRARLLLPVSVSNGTITVAMADPLDADAREAVARATGKRVEVLAGTEEGIREAIEISFGDSSSSMDRIVEAVADDAAEAPTGDERVERLIGVASEAPIIRLVNFILARAIERGASDIHLEPYEKVLRVRYRIDGVLEDVESPPRRLQTAVVSRVKIMSRLNIAESRLPQDGRVKLRIGGQEVDFRVSTIPTLYGESVVIRILDQASVPLDMGTLGFSPETLGAFRPMVSMPYGMVLVTGPTGSGKTTTLYAALQEIRSGERKIITIEDPVEYQVPGVIQIQVKPQIGLTFASGLRSIVRQDPDVILVGEIRDRETAEIAIHSALTGHMVLSTLHTNDAAGAVTRLLEMGVEEYLLPSCLMGILAQRLVRTICGKCSVPREVSRAFREEVVRETGSFPEGELRIGKGCEACGGTGYRGRAGIFELLPVTEGVKELILSRADAGRDPGEGGLGRDAAAAGRRVGEGAARGHHDRGSPPRHAGGVSGMAVFGYRATDASGEGRRRGDRRGRGARRPWTGCGRWASSRSASGRRPPRGRARRSRPGRGRARPGRTSCRSSRGSRRSWPRGSRWTARWRCWRSCSAAAPMGSVSAYLLREVRGGSSLSDAMRKAPGVPFSRFLVQMVEAGQSTGRLEEALDQAYRYMDRVREFRSNLLGVAAVPRDPAGRVAALRGPARGVRRPALRGGVRLLRGSCCRCRPACCWRASGFLRDYGLWLGAAARRSLTCWPAWALAAAGDAQGLGPRQDDVAPGGRRR